MLLCLAVAFSVYVAWAADIAFVSPGEGATVTGPVRLELSLAESLGNAKVNYYLDLPSPPEVPKEWEKYVIGGSNMRPFALVWDASLVPEGRHSITAKAYLDGDKEASATVTVFVQK